MEISLNCGEIDVNREYILMTFKPKLLVLLCEDIVVQPPPNQVIPHTHEIGQ